MRVLLTLREYKLDGNSWFCLDHKLIQKLSLLGLSPIPVIPHICDEATLNILYEMTDGVLITGGNDVSPTLYSDFTHPKTKPYGEEVDMSDIKLIRWAIRDRKPLLGICRGAQVMSVAMGGSLIQHVEDLQLNECHQLLPPSYANINKCTHAIHIIPHTKTHAIVKKVRITVNSAHHQAIDSLGEDFIASAYSPEGIIEIIEHREPSYFCFGLQSHPETQDEGSLEAFFREFANEVIRRGKYRA